MHKFLFSIFYFLFSVFCVTAQQAGVQKLLSGGTTRINGATTNTVAIGLTSTNTYGLPGTATNLAQDVSEYDYVGLTWSRAAGSNDTLQVFKSHDGGTSYEAIPSFSYAGPLASAAFETNTTLDVHGVTTLGFVIKNAGAIDDTNTLLEINLKLPKNQTRYAPE
jgi:hypothetical protein